MSFETAGIGLLLGLTRLLPTHLISEGDFFFEDSRVGGMYGAMASAFFGIPLLLVVFPVASFLLDDRARSFWYSSLNCAAYVLSICLIECLLCCAVVSFYLNRSLVDLKDAFWTDGLYVFTAISCFNLGILIESSVVFSVVRWCGYRLVRLPLAVNSPIDRTNGSG